MGTNYYWHGDTCEHCGRSGEPIHIGKSSGGWAFALHVNDEIQSLDAWKKKWAEPHSKIMDEYGVIVTAKKMSEVIEDRSWGGRPFPNPQYPDIQTMLDVNDARLGGKLSILSC